MPHLLRCCAFYSLIRVTRSSRLRCERAVPLPSSIFLAAAALAAPLHIEADPAHLELGDESVRAVLHVTSATEPRLSASAGSIVNLRREGPEAWTADYVPPPEMFPQLAFLAAVVSGELAWTVLPLWGRGVALVHTRPRASISVEIGERSFGPAQADARGEAQVSVVVPPGVHEVRHRTQRIPLPVPEIPRLHLVLLQERVRADRVEKVGVRILATDDAGKPLPQARLVLRPGRGRVTPPEQRASGESWATWILPPGAAGSARLSAALAEAPKLAAEAALAIETGPVAAVELSADRESVVAGAATEVVLRARARDAAGNPAAEPLEVSGPPGFGALVEHAAGEWWLRPPDSSVAPRTVELVAHPRGSTRPRASVMLKLLPAPIDPGVAAAHEGPRTRLLAISPKLGALSNFARLTSPVVALEASLRTDRLGPELAFSAEASWSFVTRQQAIGQLGTAQARDDFFALSAQLSVRVPIGDRTTLWAGAGPSVQAIASRLQLGSNPRVSESALVPGAIVSIGVERRFAFVVPFAEARWSWHRDPALSTLSGAVSAVSLLLGNRFELL